MILLLILQLVIISDVFTSPNPLHHLEIYLNSNHLKTGKSQTITGVIYCNNWFQFYFNGKLVAIDPLTFNPHQAVSVKFTWDGVSDKTYAIRCEDWTTSSGYKYLLSKEPTLGKGSLIAQFSDGTITNSSWSTFTVTSGPTYESIANGCSAHNQSPCKLKKSTPPLNWFTSSFREDSGWNSATEHSVSEVGWGTHPPSWVDGKGCCTANSPVTKDNLTLNDGCSVNYDTSAPTGLAVRMHKFECINPFKYFEKPTDQTGPQFIWGKDLTKDIKMLFRFTTKQGSTKSVIPEHHHQDIPKQIVNSFRTINPGGPQTITGVIFCDNWFQFYFNGKLVATDPMSFTPHQAVKVKFTWDGVSDKTYAIRCEDFSTSSGYEYTSTNHPMLGDGSLIAQFSDGIFTNSSWSMFTESFGPTNESVARGCSVRTLSLCQTKIDKPPSNWFSPSFKEDRRWISAKEYTPKEAGWGKNSTWVDGKGCCTSDSPFTMRNLTHNDGCSVNYDDSAPNTGVAVNVIQDECINPRAYFQKLMGPKFLWGNDLKRDNKMLFRFTVKPGK